MKTHEKTAKRLYEKLFKRKKEQFHASFTLNRVKCSFTIETRDKKTAEFYLGIWERHVVNENDQLHQLRVLAETVRVEQLKLKVAKQVEEMDAEVQARKAIKRDDHQSHQLKTDTRDNTADSDEKRAAAKQTQADWKKTKEKK